MSSPDLFYGNRPTPVSLLELGREITNTVNRAPSLRNVWVTAELSDVHVRGGHCYMELIEKNDEGQVVAKIRATIWQSVFRIVSAKFFQATGNNIASGMKLLLLANAAHHPVYGLSLSIADIDPSYTLGDMERLRREILAKLNAEGILNRNSSRILSPCPQKIAVISSQDAAGYGDFIRQISQNEEGFVFYTHLFPAIMQGDKVSSSIRMALDKIRRNISLWDCVVIIRGGGATTDLIGFDDYELAKAVATFPIPVIVGIGHERDHTVLDDIAHTPLRTPTAVAACIVDSARNFYNRVCYNINNITRFTSDYLAGESRRLASLEGIIPSMANSRLNEANALLQKELSRIPVLVSARISHEKIKSESIANLIATLSANRIIKANDSLDEIKRGLSLATNYSMDRESNRLAALYEMVKVLDPNATLKRGYSITRVNGKAVHDVSHLKKGDKINTVLASGSFNATITEITD